MVGAVQDDSLPIGSHSNVCIHTTANGSHLEKRRSTPQIKPNRISRRVKTNNAN